MLRKAKLRKTTFETTVILLLLLLPPIFFAVKIESADALSIGSFGSDKWWLDGHNWVFLNGLELLKRDRFTDEAEMIETYLEDVVNGLCDADEGSNRLPTYWDLGEWGSEDQVIDMRDLGSTDMNGGGFSHMYDPWSHLATGVSEDPWGCFAIACTVAGSVAALGMATGGLGLILGGGGALAIFMYSYEVMKKVMEWSDWFGKNAGEAAVKAYNRAVSAWNAGYQRLAMYYLGMVLHLIGDEAGIPYHSANLLDPFSGEHNDAETWVNDDLKAYLGSFSDWKTTVNANGETIEGAVEYGKNLGEAGTVYNINWSPDSLDHGIYLESLKDRSDGIYIAGDPVMTDYDGNFYGHIYQLPDSAAQFIDFAGHESLQWYPLFDDESGEGDLDSWWEVPNWIETGHENLHMISSTEPRDSRLIFHLNGVDRITADFEGADHNWEAIDMENSWGTRLGYVEAYDGYTMDYRVGGPWTDDGWLYGGPEPNGPGGTLQIRTVVDKGLEGDYWDDDCDGWQLSEMTFVDSVDPNDVVVDPLYRVKTEDISGVGYQGGYQYVTTDGQVGHLKDKLWDDPIPPPIWDSQNGRWDNPRPENRAMRTASIHLLDLSSKLCAGLIKCFFDDVNLPIRTPPKTYMYAAESYDPPYNNENTRTYVGSSGETYTTYEKLFIGATIGRTVWSDAQQKYVEEIVPENVVYQIHYIIDGKEQPSSQTNPLYKCGTYISIPDDRKPHTIEFWGTGRNTITGETFDEDTHHFKTYVVDKSPPIVTMTVGEPSRLIDGVWHVTADTPITITAKDINGSGVKGFYWYVTERGSPLQGGEYVVPSSVQTWEDCFSYQGPFTLGGKEVTPTTLAPYRIAGTTGVLGLRYNYARAITRELFLGLQPGDYEIGYWCYDNLIHFERKNFDEWIWTDEGARFHSHVFGFKVTLDDFIEGVDVKIDPYIQNVQPGSSRTCNISITNNYEAYNTYDVTLDGLDPTWYTLSQRQTTLGPRQTQNVTLIVSPPYKCIVLKDYKFNITASMQKPAELLEPWEKGTQEGVLRVFPDWSRLTKIDGNIVLTAPTQIQVAPGATVEKSFSIQNLDISRDNCISLKIDVTNVNPEYQPNCKWFNWTKLDLFIPAGQTATVPLRIDIPAKAGGPQHQLHLMFFDLKATSLAKFPKASDISTVYLSQDVLSPFTILKLSRQTIIDATGHVFATSQASFAFEASDGDGVGIATTTYRIYNATYDTGWITINPLIPIQLIGLSDGIYNIAYNSTDKGGNIEPTKTTPVILDNTGPTATLVNPPTGWALQDGVTFTVSAQDLGSGVHSVNASIRVADGGEGQPCGFEDLPATYDAVTGKWTVFFNTLQLLDGYYSILVETDDNLGNIGAPLVVPYSIRNWAVIELLPSAAKNKAGRTMPIKFSLRVAAAVDPTQPFVYNEELTVKIYASNDPSNILQTSTYGNGARDYRIDVIGERYITNFKTLPTPKHYTVSVYRDTFPIGSFNFQTVA